MRVYYKLLYLKKKGKLKKIIYLLNNKILIKRSGFKYKGVDL